MPKKTSNREPWGTGDYFAVPLVDDTLGIGQVPDLMMKNIVSVVLVHRRYGSVLEARSAIGASPVSPTEIFAALSTWRDPVDDGRWPIIGHGDVLLTRAQWPNERYRAVNWVGARHFNTALVEGLSSAFYALAPWDGLHDPNFYDRLLISRDKKPSTLIYSKKS